MKLKFSLFIGLVGAAIALVLTVTLVASPSEQKAVAQTAPKLSGLNIDAATNMLSDGAFVYKLMYTESDEPQGTVIKQVPAAGEEVLKNEVIRIYIAVPFNDAAEAPQPQTPETPNTQHQPQNANPNTQQQPQQNSQKTKAQLDAERKAAIDRLNAEFEAEMKVRQQKLAEEQARLAAEQARRDALYNSMLSAQSELAAARYELDRAVASVNDFAARGMLQSGAGYQASAARDLAQIRLANAIVADQAASAAWAAR